MDRAMLQPIVALAAWTLVMWAWMLAVRMPALRAAKIDLRSLTGGKGSDADRVLPAKAQWPSHNYNHLLEQPTAFYAVVVVLAITGGGGPLAVALAWAYVALRVLHSLVQATYNRVAHRFALFVGSTLCLGALTVLAATGVF